MGNVFNLIIQSYNYFPLTELVSYPVYHPASVGAATTAKVIASVKAKAVEDLFKPASAIVDEVCFHLFNDNNDECE